MKLLSMILMTAALLSAETKTSALPTQPPASSAPTAIPAGATPVEPFLYRHTDAQGKTWMYRKTPFGVAKWEERAALPTPAPTTNPVGVTDLGDSFRFETKTPFGTQIWTRKKVELSSDEKRFVEAAKLPLTQIGERP